jgi:hypothetical protein
MKFKQNIIFKSKGIEYFLFQIINIGKITDELKFNFNDNQANTSVIHNKTTDKIEIDDVINPFGESTYHADGTFLFKFPNYPLKEKIYNNPNGVGERRKPLKEIFDFEPIFNIEIFQYRLCRKTGNLKEKFEINNELFFNGEPFGCIVLILNSKYHDFPETNDKSSNSIRVRNITENLDLGLAFAKIYRKGRFIFDTELKMNIFSNNNFIEIVKKK